MQLVTRSKWVSCMFRVVAGPAAVAAHVEMCRAGLRSGGGRRGGGTMASDNALLNAFGRTALRVSSKERVRRPAGNFRCDDSATYLLRITEMDARSCDEP